MTADEKPVHKDHFQIGRFGNGNWILQNPCSFTQQFLRLLQYQKNKDQMYQKKPAYHMRLWIQLDYNMGTSYTENASVY